ncbi:MAG: TonB-dependent receptor plug domain-containing protein [Sphingomicrobium sp.]
MSQSAAAQTVTVPLTPAEQAPNGAEIVVTGSRFGPRVVTASPTPIDSISGAELTRTGGTDLQTKLKVVVPSFSTPRPVGAGANDFLTPPTLRGLSTGQLLVLVNGKRRHTNAELNANNQIGRGDVAYDFNAIPVAAISRIEVLRDGAAAQYGSDAIAGVIDLQLDGSIGTYAQARYGMTTHGDGEDIQISLGEGLRLGTNGFFRITGMFQDHNKTNRALPDTRQQYFGSNNGVLVLPSGLYGSGTGLTRPNGALDPREATFNRNNSVYGEPAYRNVGFFVNSELPLSHGITAYAFGGYNQLNGTSYNFFRRPGQDENVRAIYPNGFLPLQLSRLENASAAVGLKGEDLAGFAWDLSSEFGTSFDRLRVIHSLNTSFGTASPTSFLRGGARFRQWTSNLDVRRQIPLGAGSPLKVAFGLEYRRETYTLTPGDPASYSNGGVPILDEPDAGRPAAIGTQSAIGVSPADIIPGSRHSTAEYVETEKKFGNRLLISAALRHEKFSDFGSTTDYRLAGRFELFGGLALRGSFGTGFRAPALAQSFYGQTDFLFISGVPVRTRIFSVNEPVAKLIGASPLKPEKAKNVSLGAVFDRGPFAATIDVYRIRIKDRIVISSNFQGAALTNFLTAQGFPGIGAAAFLTNAADTTTKGLDVTARYRQSIGAGTVTATFAANFNHTKFDRIAGTPAALTALGFTTPLVDLTQQTRLTQSTPNHKQTLNLAWLNGKWSASLTGTRYGKVAQVVLTNVTPARVAALLAPGYDVTLVPSAPGSANRDIIQRFRADIVADVDVAYALTDHFSLGVGAANLFDKTPERPIASTVASVAAGTNGADNAGIFPSVNISPYGISGRFLYVKGTFKF